MTIPTASEILRQLKQARPRPTYEAPRDGRGIYGLYDHEGQFRYIGSTSSESETFYKRIHLRHRTGSETASHYFSRMYNTGRMWRLRNDLATKADGKVAKALRNAFIERHCGCVWVPLSDHADIAALEADVLRLAPKNMTAWNGRGMAPYEEPTKLVDELVVSLGLSPYERAALSRQRDRFYGNSLKVRKAEFAPPLPVGPFRFFALDVETANNDRSSICQVGVACVRWDGCIETWTTFVDPQTTYFAFSDLHGITSEMVCGAPTIGEVLDTLDNWIGDQTVYQHSGFDRSAIRAACVSMGRSEPRWTWQNSVTVARVAWPELKGNGGHGLASLKRFLGLEFEHHDAGEDARAAAEVVLLAEKGAGGKLEDQEMLIEEDNRPREEVCEAVISGTLTGSVIGRSVLTQGNINNNHFYLRGFISGFPEEVIGGGNYASSSKRTVTITWGSEPPVETDIDGKKYIFRNRSWVRRFFEQKNVRPGDTVEVLETAPFCYRVALVQE